MRALFVFCEGAHDVALLRRLLQKAGGFKPIKTSIGDYPDPLASFLKLRLGERQVGERQLEHLKKAEPPSLDFVMRQDGSDDMILLFNISGEDHESVRDFLKMWIDAMVPSLIFAPPGSPSSKRSRQHVDGWNFALLVDADSAGAQAKLEKIRKIYNEKEIMISHDLQHGGWERSGDARAPKVGFFCIGAEGQDQGTLEDIIIDWLAYSGHKKILDDTLDFLLNNAPPGSVLTQGDDAVALKAKRSKAALTCVGQHFKPSRALTLFIQEGPLLDDKHLGSVPVCRALLDFLVLGLKS